MEGHPFDDNYWSWRDEAQRMGFEVIAFALDRRMSHGGICFSGNVTGGAVVQEYLSKSICTNWVAKFVSPLGIQESQFFEDVPFEELLKTARGGAEAGGRSGDVQLKRLSDVFAEEEEVSPLSGTWEEVEKLLEDCPRDGGLVSRVCSPDVYTQADPEGESFVSPPPISYRPCYLDSPEFQFESSIEEPRIESEDDEVVRGVSHDQNVELEQNRVNDPDDVDFVAEKRRSSTVETLPLRVEGFPELSGSIESMKKSQVLGYVRDVLRHVVPKGHEKERGTVPLPLWCEKVPSRLLSCATREAVEKTAGPMGDMVALDDQELCTRNVSGPPVQLWSIQQT